MRSEFTDQVFEHKTGADAGADVDPNPIDDDHTLIGEVPTTDAEQYTAEFEEGYVPPDESLAEQRAEDFDIIPDEEFIDLE